MIQVFAARFLLVSIGCMTLDSYLAGRPAITAMNSGICAVVAIWIDRQVIGSDDNAAALGSVCGIVAANYAMTWRRKAQAK